MLHVTYNSKTVILSRSPNQKVKHCKMRSSMSYKNPEVCGNHIDFCLKFNILNTFRGYLYSKFSFGEVYRRSEI